jgi:zinc/manganese transport system permease protein
MELLWLPFIIVILLLGFHIYFGFTILKRGIIFTDLAVGQGAAFGAALAMIVAPDLHYLFAFVIAIAIALFIAKLDNHPHIEAMIGLIYALFFAAIFLLFANTTHGMEHFNALMATDILFLVPSDLVIPTITYLLIALVIFFILPRVRTTTQHHLFFILFAISVTTAVTLVGVLVVFSLLIAPALIALQLNKKFLFAYGVGTSVTIVAMMSSLHFDLPTGYTIVTLFAITALGLTFVKK